MAKKLSPIEALEKLPFLGKRGTEELIKVIKTAIESGKQKGVADTDLVLKEIQIGEGPRLKRGRAASRGRWHPYKKRMSHIRVVLTTRKSEILNPKSETGNTKNEVVDTKDVKANKIEENNNDSKETVQKKVPGGVEKATKSMKSKLQSVISKKGVKK